MPFGLGIISTFNNIMNRETQKDINASNLAFAQKQFDYQKQLNTLQMQREDNAVQRRAADLQAAGMNRLMAAGSSAEAGGMTTFSGSANQQASQMNIESNPQILAAMIQQAREANAGIAQTKAQTDLIKAQTATEEMRTENISIDSWLKKITGAKTKEEKKRIMQEIINMKDENDRANDIHEHNKNVANKNTHNYWGIDNRAGNIYELLYDVASRYFNWSDKRNNNGNEGKSAPVGSAESSGLSEQEQYMKGLIQKEIGKGKKVDNIIAKYWDSIPGEDKKDKQKWIQRWCF